MLEIIDVSDAAKAFIKQHGGVATVRLSPRHGCCGGLANVAVAETSSPNDPAPYQRHSDQAIILFIDPALACQGLRVDVEGFWKLRHLYVESSLSC
ncbi:CC/Se motif family (seleno)protein [Vreelandella indica]|uniref:CC/Se motif family (seleno)protein n=1 Tax=Vreelandella indica TaxID=3126500 RepID=UPI00300DFC58|tara:strand:+ start:4902 stop:5189 length:288 start_codon:yes stop_codon:yes gene_type:complete